MSRYGLGIDVGSGTVTAAVCSVEDEEPASPTRVLIRDGRRSDVPLRLVLPRVGDPTPFSRGPGLRTAAELLAAVVAGIREEVAGARGAAPDRTVVTVPPSWGEYRRATLVSALADAVGGECTLASSAVAAARRHRTDAGTGTVAVYDLGAGTVDTAVVRTTDDGTLEHAAVPPDPVPWGGRDIDDAVLQHVWAAVGTPEPATTTRAARRRLVDLRDACVTAKERLSTALAVRVDVELPGTDDCVRLVRADLDEVITGPVAESVAAMRAAISDAALAPADLDGIVLAGGGVLVPLVAATLSAELDAPLLVADEPALTVACGAAELAADLLTTPATADADIDDLDDLDDGPDAAVLDLDAHRRTRDQRVGLRAGIVAALLAVLLVMPLSLMDVLDGGVSTRNAPGVAVAGEPSAPVPAPAPAAPSDAAPSAASGPAATEREDPSTSRAPGSSSSAPAAASTTSPGTTSSPGPTTSAPPPAPPAASAPSVTETDTPLETETPTETETPAETDTPTETETPTETGTPTPTETDTAPTGTEDGGP